MNIFMNSALLSIKIEPKLKKEAQEIATKLGINISTVVKAKLQEFVRTQSLYLTLDENPSPALLEILNNYKNEPKSSSFTSVDNASRWLKSNEEN